MWLDSCLGWLHKKGSCISIIWSYPWNNYEMCRDEDWQDNDGALNTISMTHPRLPIEHPSRLVINDSDCQPLQPGIWLVTPTLVSLIYYLQSNYSIIDISCDIVFVISTNHENTCQSKSTLNTTAWMFICKLVWGWNHTQFLPSLTDFVVYIRFSYVHELTKTKNCMECRYYKIVEADHILFIVNRERAGVQFDLIYDSIFERCRKHVFRKNKQTITNEAPNSFLFSVCS